MKCAEFTHKLDEYASGELPAAEQAKVTMHLDACANCRAHVKALRSADDALRALPRVEHAPEMLDDLRARLATRPRNAWRWAWAGAVAVAAVAVLILCAHRPAVRPLPRPASAKVEARRPAPTVEKRETVVLQPRVVAQQTQAPVRPIRSGCPAVRRHAPSHPIPAPEQKQEPALQPAEPAAPQDAPAEVAQASGGVILLLGEPEPILPSGSCYIEVTFPDGGKSVTDQAVERDAAGEPKAVQVTYQRLAEADGPRQGG